MLVELLPSENEWINKSMAETIFETEPAGHDLVGFQAIDQYLDRVKNLPPAPVVATQLLDLFSDPDRDIDRIVELVSTDPALTAETLRRCNGGYWAGIEPATDMFDAVTRLGFYEIYCIVVGLIASRTMTAVRAKYSWDASQLWRHAVTTGSIASILAKRVQVVEATAFTAGLLHDIGKLIFISVEGVAYAERRRTFGHFGPAAALAEESSMGFSHAALGARLLSRWGLPENVCLAVQWHHQSPATATQYQRLKAAVNFANCLAHELLDSSLQVPAAAEASPEAMALVELTAKDIPELKQEIQEGLKRVEGIMQAGT
jgi:putative nucleotidyltransferase with HDIG domain